MDREERSDLLTVALTLALGAAAVGGGVTGVIRLARDEVAAVQRLSEAEKIELGTSNNSRFGSHPI